MKYVTIMANICEEIDSGWKSVLPLRQTTAAVGIPKEEPAL